MRISVCIPMYNEGTVIEENAKRLSDYMEESFEDYELVFCSDGSTDGSAEALRELALPKTRLIEYAENRGKGYAVKTAMLSADGDIRIFTDADLAYGCEVIRRIADSFSAEPEADVIIGTRSHEGGYGEYTALRVLASKVYAAALRLVLPQGLGVSDSQCGIKGFRAAAAEEIFSRTQTERFAFDMELILWARRLGFKLCELPVRVENHGASKVELLHDALGMLAEIPRIKKRVLRD